MSDWLILLLGALAGTAVAILTISVRYIVWGWLMRQLEKMEWSSDESTIHLRNRVPVTFRFSEDESPMVMVLDLDDPSLSPELREVAQEEYSRLKDPHH